MPIYDYFCTKCAHKLEVLQGLSDEPLCTCPACGKDALQKVLMSAPNFQLKGKGWYKTDYAPAKSASTESSDKPDKTDKITSSSDKDKPSANTHKAESA